MDAVCQELWISKVQLEQGFCEFLNVSGIDWENLDINPLGCLENVTKLVFVEQMVRGPENRDFYRVLHKYLWTLKVIVSGLKQVYPGDPETQDYIMNTCSSQNTAVSEYYDAIKGEEWQRANFNKGIQ